MTDPDIQASLAKREALLREMLGRVADPWTLEVIEALDAPGVLRFTEVRARVGGISQKMLTKTLRQLERDGLVTRKVHAVVPPRVDYALTALGRSLGEAVCGIWSWVEANLETVDAARRAFDRNGDTSNAEAEALGASGAVARQEGGEA
ncbi:MAG: helix-turn-helix transcriptional regulator [Thermoanaerobaculia bacterium]|nr:helix-turn-helix transcriptional regulator [Thermoanaerobaculia bacterium]